MCCAVHLGSYTFSVVYDMVSWMTLKPAPRYMDFKDDYDGLKKAQKKYSDKKKKMMLDT